MEALNNQFKSAFTTETQIPDHILPDTSPYADMPDIVFTVQGVVKILSNPKPHNTPRPDGITPRVLKQLSDKIAPILCNIYNLSYEICEIPDDWRKANVVPIYKKGDRTDPSNCRPISLMCIVCKLMEHVLANSIMQHGDRQDILFSLQYGFQQKKSCELQLLGLVSDLHNNLDQGRQTECPCHGLQQGL